MSERERERVCEREERERMRERERVCPRERERVCEIERVCPRERERDSAREILYSYVKGYSEPVLPGSGFFPSQLGYFESTVAGKLQSRGLRFFGLLI